MENNTTYPTEYQPQITSDLRNSIEEIIKNYETDYNINVFYAGDTGSRALGVSVESSDFDLNGFFFPNYKEYVRIVRKTPIIISKQGIKFISNAKEYTIDIVLWDIKDWLKEKVVKNSLGFDFLFESPIIYRDNLPNVVKEIRMLIEPPFYYFWGKMLNNYELMGKEIKKDGTQNKKIMNTLIYSIQYLHTQIFGDFPFYNIFKEIDHLKSNENKLIIEKHLDTNEFQILENCLECIINSYEEKRKGRKSLTKNIPDFIKIYFDILKDKFNAKPKKLEKMKLENEGNPWTVEKGQYIFDIILNYHKNQMQ